MANKSRRPFSADTKKQVLADLVNGLTREQIAKKHGMSTATVQTWKLEAGLTRAELKKRQAKAADAAAVHAKPINGQHSKIAVPPGSVAAKRVAAKRGNLPGLALPPTQMVAQGPAKEEALTISEQAELFYLRKENRRLSALLRAAISVE